MDNGEGAWQKALDRPLNGLDELRLHVHDPDTFAMPEAEDILAAVDALPPPTSAGGEAVAQTIIAHCDTLDSCVESFWCSTSDGTDNRLLADAAIHAVKSIRAALAQPPTSSVGVKLPDAFITSTSDRPNYFVTIKTKTLEETTQWHDAVLGLARVGR
jgi:hypothetical protein